MFVARAFGSGPSSMGLQIGTEYYIQTASVFVQIPGANWIVRPGFPSTQKQSYGFVSDGDGLVDLTASLQREDSWYDWTIRISVNGSVVSGPVTNGVLVISTSVSNYQIKSGDLVYVEVSIFSNFSGSGTVQVSPNSYLTMTPAP